MGIRGIYREIGAGQRIALSRLAVETYELKGRPFRLAIDISIWLFQIQSGKGGTNPALRTFYYRLLRLMTHSIHPLFVFDGPNKPPFKRNRRIGPNVASIPAFLAKELLQKFGVPYHTAPGEAEAECALLQQKGVVDAVLSEDVDTLMFGSKLTLRSWSAEGKGKVATHISLYDSEKTKAGSSGLDREGMILVALMSGGDYVPEGIPGCGPKLACEAARAGLGHDLCKLSRDDPNGIAQWKERLSHELKTNESKFFRSKHPGLEIPEDFPRMDILRYYTHPCLSSLAEVENLRNSLSWDKELDVAGLRKFTGDAFDWICMSGAKKFIRNLAPALLMKELRLRGDALKRCGQAEENLAKDQENKLIKFVYMRRNHVTTDRINEVRVAYTPADLVKIDLSNERPDPELPHDESSSDEQLVEEDEAGEYGEVGTSVKKRAPLNYDPAQPEKLWVLEQYLKVGVPLKMREWEESIRLSKERKEARPARKGISRNDRTRTGGMSIGAIEPFTKVTKPGVETIRTAPNFKVPLSTVGQISPVRLATSKVDKSQPKTLAQATVVEVLSSPEKPLAKRTRTLGRSQTDSFLVATQTTVMNSSRSTIDTLDLSGISEEKDNANNGVQRSITTTKSPGKITSKAPKTSRQIPSERASVITIDSSPQTPRKTQSLMTQWLSPSSRSISPSPTGISKQEQIDNQFSGQVSPLQDAKAHRLNSPLLQKAETFQGELSPLEKWNSASQRKMIRCRDSLVGTWKLDEPSPEVTNGKKSRAGRNWRVSQIEVLDLT